MFNIWSTYVKKQLKNTIQEHVSQHDMVFSMEFCRLSMEFSHLPTISTAIADSPPVADRASMQPMQR
jgi:hypothetical protein